MIRRLAVTGVCLVVGLGLYLRPDRTTPTGFDEPVPVASSPGVSVPPTSPEKAHPSSTASPLPGKDRSLPTPVRGLRLVSNTASHYLIGWNRSHDAAGIQHYVVLVDGYLTGTVKDPWITLTWPASTANILIQVAAVDGNGNQGEWRAIVVIPPPLAVAPPAKPATPTQATSTTPTPTPMQSTTTVVLPQPSPDGSAPAPTQSSTAPTSTVTTPSQTPSPSVTPSTLAPSSSAAPSSSSASPTSETPTPSPSETLCPSEPAETVTATGTPAPSDPSDSPLPPSEPAPTC